MKEINLRDYYPFYTCDMMLEVPDEVAVLLNEYRLKDAAYYLRTYRHKAYYSLDRSDGIEGHALIVALSPFEVIEQRRMTELIYKALSTLPDKQRERIYAHYFLGMSKAAIARAEGINESNVRKSINRGLESLQIFLKNLL